MRKIGIVGYGKMGQLRHKVLEAGGYGKVTKVHDPYFRPELEGGEIVVCDDWQEIVSDPEIDAIFIATVNALNKPITIAALQNGKHVFCEKPPALTAPDIVEIQGAERESNRTLMYGFNHRQHGAALHMRRIVEEGEFGRILWMRGRYGKSVDSNFLDTWRANKALSGGGILIDQGIHMLDLFLYLGGRFDEVQAMVSSLYWKQEGIEDNVFAMLRNSDSGMIASLHSTMTQWRHLFSLEVFMERGYMVLNGLKTSSNSYGEEELVIALNRSVAPAATWQDEERHIYPIDTSWETEAKIFFDALDKGKPITSGSSDQALAVMSLIDRIYENSRHEAETLYSDLNARV